MISDVGVFLCGDVMTGRGVDQILPSAGSPELKESVVTDARTYVKLAERVNGPIPRPAEFDWPWGAALPLLESLAPDVRLINLETSITAGGEFAPGKEVHYRMHPANVACLTAIHPDVCALANNHVLDFGHRGLRDTLQTLSGAEIRGVGAGFDAEYAQRPAVVPLADGSRVVIGACGSGSSGIPPHWAADDERPGMAFVRQLSTDAAFQVAERVLTLRRPGDIAVVSVHWGSNWSYDVEPSQVQFAHCLIDAGIDVVHGHSSHHPRPIEVYRGKLILYGCGDTIDDYEGIRTFEAFRHELRLLYFASINRDSGALITLRMTPMRMRRMRLDHVPHDDAEWLRSTLQNISRPFGTQVNHGADDTLTIRA